LPPSGIAPLSVARPAAKAPLLAVRVQGTDKDPIPAASRHLTNRQAANLDLVLARGGSMTNADARSLAAAVRRETADAVASTGATGIFLYASVPQGLAMLLGHEWNALPPTTMFEYQEAAYRPSLTV
jgi:hypothetical protein